MNIKWKVILSVMLIIFILCTSFTTILIFDAKGDLDNFVEINTKGIKGVANTVKEQATDHYRKRIKSFLNYHAHPIRDNILKAFAIQDREELLRLTKPFFDIFKKENPYFSTFTWILPDNKSFLFLHNPKKPSTDVSKWRPDIVSANKEGRQYAGFATGPAGLQYRIVNPVIYDDKHIGVLHFGLKDSLFIDAIHKKLQIPVGMIIPQDKYQFVKRSKIPTIREHSFAVQSNQLELFKKDHGRIDWSLEKQRVVLQGKDYIILKLVALNNYVNDPQGHIFVALDISDHLSDTRSDIIFIITLSSILMLLSFLILYFSYGTLAKKVIDLQVVKKINRELEDKVSERTQELIKNRNYLQSIFNAPNEAIFIHDAGSGAILDVNQAMLDMYGFTYEQALQVKPNDTSLGDYPYNQEEAEKKLKLAITDEPQTFEWMARKKNGSLFWVEVGLNFTEHSEHSYVIAVVRDISKRKESEEALHEKERFQKKLLNDMVTFVAVLELNGDVIFVNNTPLKVGGLKLEDVIGKKFFDAPWWTHLDEVRNTVIQDIERCRSGESLVHDIQIQIADGSLMWIEYSMHPIFDEDGNVQYLIPEGRDITDRKLAEEQLIILSLAIETSPDVIIITNLNGNLTYANKALMDIYGYAQEELIGTPVAGLGHDKSFTRAVIFPAIKETGGWQGEMESERKDGTVFPILLTSSLISDQNHKPIGMLGIVKDLTEIKVSKQKKTELEKQLQQAQKMEAIGTLAGGIAHDFNNILGAILGYADMAKDEAPEHSIIRADLEKVLIAGNRAKELVAQILAFSRQAKSEQKTLRPNSVVKEAVKLLRSSIPTTIKIEQDIEEECGMIKADHTQLHQVIMNLCTNAYQAMEEQGGTLSISLGRTELTTGDLREESSLSPGSYIQFTVADTGPGIDSATLKKIFDPYFTTKEVGKGTGMGLSVVHGIVKNHGGMIRYGSKVGKGTSFHVFFPEIVNKHEEETITDQPIPSGNERILFIDDEVLLADMGQQLLERLGYSVTASTNSLEALEIFKAQPDQFDLVITDQTMPGMTGNALAREVFNIRSDMPVILCTGYSSIISREKALAMGIDEFVMKPMVKKDIAPLIRRVLDSKKAG